MNKSIATIDAPQFINLQPLDINPLMSKCEIKVLYIDGNRNGSWISKETATEMAKTLRGAPIVGYYNESKEDFGDHGSRVIIEGGEIKFECLTRPYGFVSPDAEVWFQNFEDEDEFGNITVREYLMTTGYLWTGQYEECKSVVQGEGKPHSMELDEDTVKGHWSTDKKSGLEFFIINDAIFSKLCILGEDVEPCFEGSSVSAPNVSKTFSKMDNEFKRTLFSMMQDLKDAIKGGQQMELNEGLVQTEEVVAEPVAEEVTPEPVVDVVAEPVAEEVAPTVEPEAPVTDSDFAALQKDEEQGEVDNDSVANPEEKPTEEFEKTPEENPTDNSKEEPKKEEVESEEEKAEKYALIETELAKLKISYAALSEEVTALREFKASVEEAEKDKLINSFYMLSEEDKKEVVENKSSYTLEQIENKLSVICVRKKVNFNLEENAQSKKDLLVCEPIKEESNEPAWISAVKNFQKR